MGFFGAGGLRSTWWKWGKKGGEGEREREREGGLTWLYDVGELFADGEHQDFCPEFQRLRFGDAERPGAAFDVAGVLPHGLDAALEEVHRVLQLEGVKGEGIQDLPERFGGDDVLFHEGEAAFVVLRLCVLVVVECPGVLEGWRPKVPDEGQSAGDLGVFVLGDWAEGSGSGGSGEWRRHPRRFHWGLTLIKDLLDVECE